MSLNIFSKLSLFQRVAFSIARPAWSQPHSAPPMPVGAAVLGPQCAGADRRPKIAGVVAWHDNGLPRVVAGHAKTGDGAGLRSRAHTAGAGLKPAALTRRVFPLALAGSESCCCC